MVKVATIIVCAVHGIVFVFLSICYPIDGGPACKVEAATAAVAFRRFVIIGFSCTNKMSAV